MKKCIFWLTGADTSHMNMFMEQIETCRDARLRLGLSQEQLAKELGVTQSMISRLEARPNLRYRLALSGLEARK